jgi:hypothetical protein
LQGKAELPFIFIRLDEIYIRTANWGVGCVDNKRTWKSFLRVEATYLLDVPSVGEFFAVLVDQLVSAGLEHLDHDVRSLPRG